MDESQSQVQPFLQSATPQPQQQQSNQLGGLMQGAPAPQRPMQMSKAQLQAGLHHLEAFQKVLSPLMNSPDTGTKNIRPKIFDASATLIGQGIFTVPEVMNGIKDLPEEPLGQKKWLQQKLTEAMLAEKKLIHDYIAQGPQQQPDQSEWSQDSHKEHVSGLMENYKR
jgi:hypothetical protein